MTASGVTGGYSFKGEILSVTSFLILPAHIRSRVPGDKLVTIWTYTPPGWWLSVVHRGIIRGLIHPAPRGPGFPFQVLSVGRRGAPRLERVSAVPRCEECHNVWLLDGNRWQAYWID